MPNALRQRTLGTPVAKQVADLVDARDARVAGGRALEGPSPYWADFIENFAYVFELSDASLNQLRRHTYHLTSDLYLRYYLSGELDAARILARYEELRQVSPRTVLAEPSTGIGYPHKDGLVSWDVLRYMSVIRDLRDAGVLNEENSLSVLEIGGGYGGLCRVMATFNPHVRYTILDLEETLFFSKSYLDRTLPDHDVRLVRHVSELEFRDKRIHLIPQHLIDELQSEFDLAINHQSIQEMQFAQVDRYLDFIAQHCRRFYSRNMRRHDIHLALRKDLSLDVQSQVLTRFPELVWYQNPTHEDTLIDENLSRFVVSCVDRRDRRAPGKETASRPLKIDWRVDEWALHRGSEFEAYPLPVGSSFVLTLASDADALALSFVTWLTTVKHLKLGVVVGDSTHQVLEQSTVVCLEFRDWEEVVVDLRGLGRPGEISVEVSVLECEGSLGLPLFESNTPRICRLLSGPPAGHDRVPAGRLLTRRPTDATAQS